MYEQGMLGEVHYVRAFWYRNSAADNPAWRYAIPPEANEQNSDWDKFLGPAPKRQFDLHRYYQWRLYWDYSGASSTDLLVHQTDIVNFVCGKTLPSSCMGFRRYLSLDRERRRPRRAGYPERDLRLSGSLPYQLQLLFRQRPVRIWGAVLRNRGHHSRCSTGRTCITIRNC